MRRWGRWLLLPVMLAGIAPAEAAPARPGFRQVARLPLVAPELPHEFVASSGWLVVDPTSRRGYQLFESRRLEPGQGVVTRTLVQSFDLDTLALRRRAELDGAPVTAGPADVATVSGTVTAGEVVHAVDHQWGRVYLALSRPSALEQQPAQLLAAFGSPPDGQRPLDRFVAVDESAFDRGDASFASPFVVPPTQARLASYWVVGMTAPAPGKLLVLFAQPQPFGTPAAALLDHTLTQWDVGDGGATVDWEVRLDACAGGSLASPGAQANGSYQWGLLVTAGAVWTACSGAAVAVPLDERGRPVALAGQTRHPVAPQISDVLVDERNQRLLVRTFGDGVRLAVFDTAQARVVGTVTLTEAFAAVALGVDPDTGRVYALVPDHEVAGEPVAGGLGFSDPPAPFVAVAPELASPAVFRIQVDPATRRFFVRRGHALFDDEPEPFYRVFRDRTKEP